MREKAKKFWYFISEKKLSASRAALILGSTYLVSNILGVFRERLIAARFGATHMTDIFYASFKIPDVIYNLLVLGAVSSAFIPIFVDSIHDKDDNESNYVASNFLNFLLILTIVLGIVIYVLAWKLVPLLLPGFFSEGVNTDLNTLSVAVISVRVMLLSPILFAISAVLGGVLNSHKRFLSYAMAPVVYNLAIILSIIYLSPKTNPPIYGILAGVVIGAFAHAAIQLFPAIMTGFRYKFVLNLRKYKLPKIIKLTIPRMLAMGAQQVNIVVDTVIASFFVGGITMLNFANNVQTVPTVIFGIAISTAIFPVLAELETKGQHDDFKKTISESLRKILFFMIPASIGMIVLRAQIIRLFYGVGNFGWDNTMWTAKALGYFAIGVAAQGIIPLLLRGFYALKDTKTPFIVSVLTMIVNVIFAVSLPFIVIWDLQIAGVALAFSIAGFVNAGLLFYFLENKIGKIDSDNKLFASLLKISFLSIVMGILAHYSLFFFDLFVDTERVIGLFTQTMGAVTFAVLFYFGTCYLLKIDEARDLLRRPKKS